MVNLTTLSFTRIHKENNSDSVRRCKASGDDGFPPNLLKELVAHIVEALALILIKSLDDGLVSTDWKIANVTPMLKKRSRQLPDNYRPLTPHSGKIFEAILNDHVAHHLDRYKLINKSQHGFISKRSCLRNLLEFLRGHRTFTAGMVKSMPLWEKH